MTQNEHLYAIFCRPEVVVISGENVKINEGYALLDFEAASSLVVSDIFKISHLRNA